MKWLALGLAVLAVAAGALGAGYFWPDSEESGGACVQADSSNKTTIVCSSEPAVRRHEKEHDAVCVAFRPGTVNKDGRGTYTCLAR